MKCLAALSMAPMLAILYLFRYKTQNAPRAVITLVLLSIGSCLITGETLFASLAAANIPHKELTFTERVAYQRAIEEVLWRHRIWPKENSRPKPSLGAMISSAQLQKKVEDYLHESELAAKKRDWPISARELQAEMDRMASHTKQPDVLRELFAALGNDPFVIAECLARPMLAEQLSGD